MAGESSGGLMMWRLSKAMKLNVSPGRSESPYPCRCAGGDHGLFCSRHPDVSSEDYADLAIHLYQKSGQHDLDGYQLLEGLGSSRVLSKLPGFDNIGVADFCHVCFVAAEFGVSPRVLCFAELVDLGYGDGLVLNSLSIAKPGQPAIGSLAYGCGFCPNDQLYPHPPSDVYAAGRQTVDFSSQFEMAAAFRNKEVLDESLYFTFMLCSSKKPPRSLSGFAPLLSKEDYAAIALAQINAEEGMDFELVETMYANCKMVTWYVESMWCHVGFSAKSKNTDDAPLCHFFAELNDPGKNEGFSLKVHHKFNPSARGTKRGCGICPKDYPHPSYRRHRFNVGDLYGMIFCS